MKKLWRIFKIYFLVTFVSYGFTSVLANNYEKLAEKNKIANGEIEGDINDYSYHWVWFDIIDNIKRAVKAIMAF